MSNGSGFERITLIGLGLINSSLARVLRRFDPGPEIVGCARSQATVDKGLALGLIDRGTLDPRDAAAGADLIVLGSPVGSYGAIAEAIGPALKPGTIVTDVGSVKGTVIRDVGSKMPQGVHFVPGHPVAGTERSGPEAGFAELFDGRWCILTPPEGTAPQAVDRVADLWRAAGMNIEIIDAEYHDRVLAITSHLPHLIAYNIVGTVADLEAATQREVIKYAAGGFRDFTRIAASDPVMWRDIFLNNKPAVLEMLGRFTEDLAALQRAIRWDDGDYLEELFARTRTIRRDVIEAKQA